MNAMLNFQLEHDFKNTSVIIVSKKKMRIFVNKHGLVYLDFGRAGSISLQLYLTYHRLLHVRVAVKSHALPVHKKNRITSLLCIFETII